MIAMSPNAPSTTTMGKKKPVAITFIVPLFNHLQETRVMLRTLEASLPSELSYELIFVNDASTDRTATWLKGKRSSRIRVITNRTNLGYARSNNKGAKAAKGTLLCLLNNDLVFQPGWLEPMLAVINDKALRAGIVGNVQYRVGDSLMDHAGVLLTESCKFTHLTELEDDAPTQFEVIAVTGACMLMRKTDYFHVGGFDEKFVNGGEDYDLCFAVRAAGKAVYVAAASSVRHHVGVTRGAVQVRNEQNSRYLFCKWRREIKRRLSSLWKTVLDGSRPNYAPVVQGILTKGFLANPKSASVVVAEFLIRREEHRWLRELDGVNPNEDIANRCKSYGLHYDASRKWYVANGEFGVAIGGLKSARNFYVCGVWIEPLVPVAASIVLTISVNNIQQQSFILDPSHNINVGIIDPIVLPRRVNQFKVTVHMLLPAGRQRMDASRFIALTHIVVDDQVVSSI